MTVAKTNWIAIIASIVSTLGFIVMVLAYVYSYGEESREIDNLWKAQGKLEQEQKDINTRLDDQFKIVNGVDNKLTLLLDYFDITDSAGHD